MRERSICNGLQSGKIRTVIILIMLGVAAVFYIVGCSRENKHKILTFFFEGVPSLDSDMDPNKAGKTVVFTLYRPTETSTGQIRGKFTP